MNIYDAHRYDANFRLKISPLLWLTMIHGLRHVLFWLNAYMPGGDAMASTWSKLQESSWLMVSDALVATVLWLAGNRMPDAQPWLRSLWHRGRALLIVAYAVDLIMFAYIQRSILMTLGHRHVATVLLTLAIDAGFLLFLWRSALVRDIFADYPEADDIERKKDPNLVRRNRVLAGEALLEMYPSHLAEEALRNQLLRQPDHPELWHQLGLAALQTGDIRRATDFVRHASRIDGTNPLFLRNLGELCRRQGLLEESVRCGQSATRLCPDDADAHYNLGLAWSQAGRISEAMTSYRQALAKNARHAPAWNNLGVLLRQVGNLSEASQAFQNSVQLAPHNQDAQQNLAALQADLHRATATHAN